MQSEAVLERHLLVRRDPPLWSFRWRGALPLAALVLLGAFAAGPVARGWIEGAVRAETRAQLDAAGYHWVLVSVSGQNVTLSGEAPTSEAGLRALAVAHAATCPTFFGRRTCASSVSAAFTSAPPPAAVAAAPATGPAAAAPAQVSALACEHSLASVLAGEQIRFARDSATISGRSAALLDRLAQQIRSCPGNIRIEGYTDSAGLPRANRALSLARAQAVRAALVARGIAEGRLEARGFGSLRPLVSNHTAKGRARNRRIEFHSLPARSA